jgi:hypothetical protein
MLLMIFLKATLKIKIRALVFKNKMHHHLLQVKQINKIKKLIGTIGNIFKNHKKKVKLKLLK